MKKYMKLYMGICVLLFFYSCSQEKDESLEDSMRIDAFEVTLEGMNNDVSTKAVSDYKVNTGDDPTRLLAGRESWSLLVTIYKGNDPYNYGTGYFSWSAVDGFWTPDATIYFPNYTRQDAELLLQPSGFTAIQLDQSAADGSGLLGQDVLIQNGNPTITIYPAHILQGELKHAYSMLDFRITGVNDSSFESVTVDIDGDIYTPYQVVTGDDPEYMVIVPVGTSTPIVKLAISGTTSSSPRYTQTTVNGITNTAVNGCYCFTLEGLELRLGEVNIADWTTGPGIGGQYTTEMSYPTFRGPAGAIATIFYDNGLEQVLFFNDQGEDTQKPAGRTIIRIRTPQGLITPDPPIVLRNMVVNLTEYF